MEAFEYRLIFAYHERTRVAQLHRHCRMGMKIHENQIENRCFVEETSAAAAGSCSFRFSLQCLFLDGTAQIKSPMHVCTERRGILPIAYQRSRNRLRYLRAIEIRRTSCSVDVIFNILWKAILAIN